MRPASSRFYEFGPFRLMRRKECKPVSLSPKAFDTAPRPISAE
jgi:hypothetical protein